MPGSQGSSSSSRLHSTTEPMLAAVRHSLLPVLLLALVLLVAAVTVHPLLLLLLPLVVAMLLSSLDSQRRLTPLLPAQHTARQPHARPAAPQHKHQHLELPDVPAWRVPTPADPPPHSLHALISCGRQSGRRCARPPGGKPSLGAAYRLSFLMSPWDCRRLVLLRVLWAPSPGCRV